MIKSVKKPFRIVSFSLVIMLCLCLICPIALARGSYYIDSYSVSMSAGSNGNVTAWFQILGVDTMDQIGAVTVTIYENGSLVKTYSSTTTSGMMAYNTFFYGSSITYPGTIGKTYYAYVTFQAGRNGDWDNRLMQTNTVTACK